MLDWTQTQTGIRQSCTLFHFFNPQKLECQFKIRATRDRLNFLFTNLCLPTAYRLIPLSPSLNWVPQKKAPHAHIFHLQLFRPHFSSQHQKNGNVIQRHPGHSHCLQGSQPPNPLHSSPPSVRQFNPTPPPPHHVARNVAGPRTSSLDRTLGLRIGRATGRCGRHRPHCTPPSPHCTRSCH